MLNIIKDLKMKVYKEIDSLDEIEFWGPAVTTIDELSDDDKEIVFDAIDECYPDGIDETKLNDILAYDDDWIRELLGYDYSEYDSKEDMYEKQEEYIVDLLKKAYPDFDEDDMQAFAIYVVEKEESYDDYDNDGLKEYFISKYGEDHARDVLMSHTDNEWEDQIEEFISDNWDFDKPDDENIAIFDKFLEEDEDYQAAMKESWDELEEDRKRDEK